MPRKQYKVCRDCGHEEIVRTYSPGELKKAGMYPVSPKCANCGSSNIEYRD